MHDKVKTYKKLIHGLPYFTTAQRQQKLSLVVLFLFRVIQSVYDRKACSVNSINQPKQNVLVDCSGFKFNQDTVKTLFERTNKDAKIYMSKGSEL